MLVIIMNVRGNFLYIYSHTCEPKQYETSRPRRNRIFYVSNTLIQHKETREAAGCRPYKSLSKSISYLNAALEAGRTESWVLFLSTRPTTPFRLCRLQLTVFHVRLAYTVSLPVIRCSSSYSCYIFQKLHFVRGKMHLVWSVESKS